MAETEPRLRFEASGPGVWHACTPLAAVGELRRDEIRGGWELVHLSRWVGDWRDFRPGPGPASAEPPPDVRRWAVETLLLALFDAAEREWVRQHPPGPGSIYLTGGQPR